LHLPFFLCSAGAPPPLWRHNPGRVHLPAADVLASTANWWRPLAWLAFGLCIYYFYGRLHSVLTRAPGTAGQLATGGAGKRGAEPVEAGR